LRSAYQSLHLIVRETGCIEGISEDLTIQTQVAQEGAIEYAILPAFDPAIRFDFVDDLSNFQIPRQKAMVGVLCWSELQFADLGHEETPDWVRTVLMSKEPGGRRRWPWMAHPMC